VGLEKKMIESRGLNKGLACLRKAGGVLIILIGLFLLWETNG
jgi:hypothetical protein